MAGPIPQPPGAAPKPYIDTQGRETDLPLGGGLQPNSPNPAYADWQRRDREYNNYVQQQSSSGNFGRDESVRSRPSGEGGVVGGFLQEQQGGGGTASAGGQPRIPIYEMDLGTHIQIYFDDGTTQTIPKGRFPSQGASGDPDLGRRQAFDAAEAERQRQFQLDLQRERLGEEIGFDKARFNTEFPLAEAGTTGFYQGAPTLAREQFGEGQRQFDLQFPEGQRQFDVTTGINYYTDLMARAANPRNYVQTLFERRGVQAPAGSEAFGNTAGETPGSIGTLAQFLPNFLGYAGAQSPNFAGYTPPGIGTGRNPEVRDTSARRQPAPEPAPAPATARQPIWTDRGWMDPGDDDEAARSVAAPAATSSTSTASGYGAYDDARLRDIVASGGVNASARAAEQLTSRGVTDLPYALGAETTKKARAKGYADGGVIPEPVIGIGLTSGQPYSFGEKGPEGVVPADYLPDFLKKRSGRDGRYATGGIIGFDEGLYGGDLYGGKSYSSTPDYSSGYLDPGSQTINTAPRFSKSPGGGIAYPSSPLASGGYTSPITQPTPVAGAVSPTQPSLANAGPAPFTISSQQQDEMNRQLAESVATNDRLQNQPRTVTQQPAPVVSPGNEQDRQRTIREGLKNSAVINQQLQQQNQQPTTVVPPVVTPPTTVTPPAERRVQRPGFVPQSGQTAAPAEPGLPTVRETSPAGTFGNMVGNSQGYAARPQFLPGEDQTPLQALLASGSLPPFLSRLFGQEQGIHSQGTNRPQRFDLPPDVPMVSRLSWLQMLPTERAAFESYLSGYGIPIEDYLWQVENLSPQGPQTSLPTFGSSFQSYRQ